jgi:hypothetical protein
MDFIHFQSPFPWYFHDNPIIRYWLIIINIDINIDIYIDIYIIDIYIIDIYIIDIYIIDIYIIDNIF